MLLHEMVPGKNASLLLKYLDVCIRRLWGWKNQPRSILVLLIFAYRFGLAFLFERTMSPLGRNLLTIRPRWIPGEPPCVHHLRLPQPRQPRSAGACCCAHTARMRHSRQTLRADPRKVPTTQTSRTKPQRMGRCPAGSLCPRTSKQPRRTSNTTQTQLR